MRIGRRAVAAALVPAFARAECRSGPSAVVPLVAPEGFAVIGGQVGGVPASFLLDTGAQAHLVLPQAQATFQFPALPGSAPLIGTGGERRAPLVLLDRVVLGGQRLLPSPAPVTSLPLVPSVTPALVGLLGVPLLEQFDLLLDPAAGRLGLFAPEACGAAVPAIAARMTAVPLAVSPDREVLLTVRVDGQAVTALLDSGSRATLLTVEAAARLGVRAPVSANTARGVDGERVPVGHAVVGTMSVGDDVRREVPVSVAPLQLGRADMLLGFDYLRQRRSWISLATRTLAIGVPDRPPSGR